MKIRHYLRYPVDITRAKRKLSDRDESDEVYSGRPVVLDLYTTDLLLDCGRHFSAIAHLGAANGSPVIVRCSRLVLAAIAHKPFGSQMLEMSNVGWIDESKSLPENALVLTDVSDSPSNRPGTGRTPVILLIGKDIVDQYPVMPYPMHPGVRKHAGRIQIEACRGINDRRGIFFSGSQRAKYGRDVLRNGFGVLNRLEILKHIRTAFPERVAESRDTAKHPMPIILPAPEGAKATAPISIDRWLPALAKHQFFLCCPGIAQPMCHNIIEAMSVGVIPIIEYPERFSPPLVDGVTAICFRGTE